MAIMTLTLYILIPMKNNNMNYKLSNQNSSKIKENSMITNESDKLIRTRKYNDKCQMTIKDFNLIHFIMIVKRQATENDSH